MKPTCNTGCSLFPGRSMIDARLCKPGDEFDESEVLRMPRGASPCLSKIIEAKYKLRNGTTGTIQADDANDMKTFEIDSDSNLFVDLNNDFPMKDTELNNPYNWNHSGIKAIYPKSSER